MKMKKTLSAFLLVVCFVAAGILTFPKEAQAKELTSLSQAEELALKSVKNARVTDAEQEYKNGVLLYEIQLRKGTKEYDLVYRAVDSKLLSYEWEEERIQRYSKKPIISEEKCRKLAARKVSGGKIVSIVGKYDDGIYTYKVKMIKADKSYTLKYHARTGRLLEYAWKLTQQKNPSINTYIGTEKAIAIALKKVSGAEVLQVEFDRDDGVPVYEVKLVKDMVEYEIKIHAKTGKILEIEKDFLDDDDRYF